MCRRPLKGLLTLCVAIAVGNYLYIDGGEIATWDGSGEGLLSIFSWYNATGNINVMPGWQRPVQDVCV